MEKTTLEDYKRKKGILPTEDYGTIYVFSSSREGVEEIKECLVWEKTQSGTIQSPTERKGVKSHRYSIKESPYSVELYEDEIVTEEMGLFSGFGDCWGGSKFASFDLKELEKRRKLEKDRVQKEYLNFDRIRLESIFGQVDELQVEAHGIVEREIKEILKLHEIDEWSSMYGHTYKNGEEIDEPKEINELIDRYDDFFTCKFNPQILFRKGTDY
jgi:hypothetical protein